MTPTLGQVVRSFFEDHLTVQKGLRPASVRSYRDVLRLFLGHPTYALTVVIFSMLVSSGLGSFFSRRLLGTSEGRLAKALGAVALLASLLALLTSSMLTSLVGLPLPLKIALTVLLIAPPGGRNPVFLRGPRDIPSVIHGRGHGAPSRDPMALPNPMNAQQYT